MHSPSAIISNLNFKPSFFLQFKTQIGYPATAMNIRIPEKTFMFCTSFPTWKPAVSNAWCRYSEFTIYPAGGRLQVLKRLFLQNPASKPKSACDGQVRYHRQANFICVEKGCRTGRVTGADRGGRMAKQNLRIDSCRKAVVPIRRTDGQLHCFFDFSMKNLHSGCIFRKC